MNEKTNINYLLLELIYIPVFFLMVFFILATSFILLLSLSDFSILILFFPMSSVVSLTIYYFKSKNPVESLNRLILIDAIIFVLYLTLFMVLILVMIDPLRYFLFNFVVLSTLYRFYHFLLIPLISVISVTYYYLKINNPVRGKILYIILITKTSIIIIFFVGYFLLNWSVPFFQDVYNGLPDFD